jgi:TonB family protein
VLLKVVVGTDGKARDFKVIRTLGFGLDEQAIAAVSAWQFQPGVKGGQPVNVFAQIEVNFRLLQAKWHLARAEFHIPEGVSRPVVEKAEAPRNADSAISANATLTLDVDENGEPVNLRIDKSSDEEWGVNVMAALSKWKFTPASKDGNPIPVSCTMDFVRGN